MQVRRWEPVAALFGLLWDAATRRIALSMVRLTLLSPLLGFASQCMCNGRV